MRVVVQKTTQDLYSKLGSSENSNSIKKYIIHDRTFYFTPIMENKKKTLHTQGALKIYEAKFCTELSGNFAEVQTANLVLWPLQSVRVLLLLLLFHKYLDFI